MATVLRADDEVKRFASVWYGPEGGTLPFAARYSAYGVFAIIFALVMLFMAVTPLDVATVPVWEVAYSVLGTTLVMQAVDQDKPVRAVLGNVIAAARLATRRQPPTRTYTFRLVTEKRHTNRDPHAAQHRQRRAAA